MPKISEAGGPTHAGVTSTPTQAQYEDAMTRHGTAEWTDADQRVKDLWDESRKAESDRLKKGGDPSSDGNSSSASSDSEQMKDDRTEQVPPQRVRTTENPSSQAPTASSTAQQTGGSGTAKSSTGDKK